MTAMASRLSDFIVNILDRNTIRSLLHGGLLNGRNGLHSPNLSPCRQRLFDIPLANAGQDCNGSAIAGNDHFVFVREIPPDLRGFTPQIPYA